ncbi:MAG: hypothetical protein KDC32_28535, partial [Saprospiraceae bacterium]|nr:hypothetical protein [Saprospiraceae bacterium]
GLYVTLDDGSSWRRFDNNLPRVGVRALAIHPRDHALVVGTHGRGIYLLDDLRLLRQIDAGMLEEDLHFFATGPTYLTLSRGGTP